MPIQLQVFFFFGGIGILAVLFAIFFIPETKQVPIEEIEEVVFNHHWFWKRITHGTKAPIDQRVTSITLSKVGGSRPTLSFVDAHGAGAPGAGLHAPAGAGMHAPAGAGVGGMRPGAGGVGMVGQ